LKKTKFSNCLFNLNYLPVFDPSLWPKRELASRITAIVMVGLFLFLKLYHFDQFPGTFEKANSFYSSLNKYFAAPVFSVSEIRSIWLARVITWTIETGILLAYILSYLSRARAIGVAKGFMEVVFPFVVAAIPCLISFAPCNLPQIISFDYKYHVECFLGIVFLIIAGGIINLTGLLTLRRGFTIMSEARVLITSGIFCFMRHPLYTGHFLMFFGSLCLRLHSYTIAMYVLFVAGQFLRAQIEEKKLSATFPEYVEYIKKTGMFFPKRLR